MSATVLRRWIWVHKWTSLFCTLFLLVLCITGLPLIFADDIQDWLNPATYAALPEGTPNASLDTIVGASHARYPNEIITSISVDDDEPKVIVRMAPSWHAFATDAKSRHWIKFDARTGAALQESRAPTTARSAAMEWIYRLHSELFLSNAGELFLAVVAITFLVAIVSGVVLYGPFMRKLDFGTVRQRHRSRLRWIDLHNLLGIITAAWVLVVGLTGFMNAVSVPLFTIWQQTDVRHALAAWRGRVTPSQSELSSLQAAYETAKQAVPETLVTGIVFPGAPFGSPLHYLFWSKGKTPLTHRLFNPILVDATDGRLTAVLAMPWYLRTLEISRPLHFGDYGGLPLKILWALFDGCTIFVLSSGLYLWRSKHSFARQGEDELLLENTSSPSADAAE